MKPNQFFGEGSFSLRDLQGEFDRLVERLWHGGLSTRPLDGMDWAPSMDVIEEPGRFLIRAEVPGMSASDVEVSVLERVVTIKGTKAAPLPGGNAGRRLRSECRYGSFCRTIELPVAVNADRVGAACRNGVLEVEIAKIDAAQPRTVRVESRDAG
ncbi:MAG: Hsp20/alpha crystallin family protein [Phycisphaerae bacterium]